MDAVLARARRRTPGPLLGAARGDPLRRPLAAPGARPRRQGRDRLERPRDRRASPTPAWLLGRPGLRRRRRGRRRPSCSTPWSSTGACAACTRTAGAAHLGQLDDHADLCHGLLCLYEATFAPALARPRPASSPTGWSSCSPTRTAAGFFYAGSDGEALVARTRELEDHPTPAGNSQAAHVLLRLADLTGDAGPRGARPRRPAPGGRGDGPLPAGLRHRADRARPPPGRPARDRRRRARPDDPRTRALMRAARAGARPVRRPRRRRPGRPRGRGGRAAARRPAPGGRRPGRLRLPGVHVPGARRDSPGAHRRASR